MLGLVAFVAVLVALLGAANAFVHRRAAFALALDRRGRRVLAGVLGLGLVLMLGGAVLARRVPNAVTVSLAGLAAVFEVGVLFATALSLVERALFGAGRMVARAAGTRPAEASPGAPTSAEPTAAEPTLVASALSRREVVERLTTGAALAAAGSAAGYAGLFGRHDYAIEEVGVGIARLPRTLDGYTIAQLSDIHLGLFVGEREMRAAVELVRKVAPDIVVLTGDLIDSNARFAEALSRLVRSLGDLAPVFAVPGNHDYYTGVDATLASVARAGARVLRNASVELEGGGLVLAGVDDLSAERFDARRGPRLDHALSGVRDDVARVLLCHQPSFFETAAPHVDVQLSGHTHGGQLNLGVRPAELVLPHGWVAGRYRRHDATLWVNRGFGTAGPPARLGAAPEVTKVVLHGA